MSSTTKNDFQIGVECFVEANKKCWKKTEEPASGDGWIYVLHTLHSEFTLSVLEDIVAKGIQRQTSLPIVSIVSGKKDELARLTQEMDISFGIDQRYHLSYYDYNNEEIEKIAKKMSSDTYGDKDGLINLTYRDIRFGDSLYDDILRRGIRKRRGDIFDCFEITQEKYYAFIRNALAIIDQAYELFKKRTPRYLITTEYFYTKALYAHVANALGAKILITSVNCPDIVVQINPDKYRMSDIKYADITRIHMEKCLQENRVNDVYDKDFFVREADQTKNVEISKDNRRKNVFVLPHAFSDSPREACRHNIYHDYAECFCDTLRIIRNIPNINWFIKDHPWSDYYGQSSYFKSIFEKYKADHMYWVDKDCAGINIKDFTDCVLTCAGDAGIEYWAYGIPTITVADGYYCNWGISYQMRTLDEYESMLKNIENVEKPSEQSVNLAKKYLFAYKSWFKKKDELVKLLIEFRQSEEAIWKTNGVPYGEQDSVDQQLGRVTRDFCEAYAELLQKSDLKLSEIYLLNNLVEA
jgi:hypothetical protein